MRKRNMLLVCGTLASLMTVGQAAAQNEQPRQPTTPPPVEFPAVQPARTTPSTPAANAPAVLRDLEGVWRVEIQCHGDHWQKMDKDGMDKDKMERDRTTSQPNPKPTDPNKQPPDPTDPTNPKDPAKPANPSTTPNTNPDEPNNPNRIQDPFKKGDPAGTSVGGMKQYVGYAETKLIMGGNVLQEKVIIPDMMTSGTGRTPQRVDGSPTTVPSAPSDDMFRSLGYISFDPSTNQYDCAFIDGRTGKIHHDRGTYNESSKQLIFEGKGHAIDDGKDAMRKHENVRVVVDVISPTQHRVTMYKKDMGRSPTIPPTPNTPAPENTKSTGDGSIVYQATYTKASGDDAPKFRRLLAEPGMPSTVDNRDKP